MFNISLLTRNLKISPKVDLRITRYMQTYKHYPLGEEDIPFPPYGGRHIVTMLAGDGIGPELMKYVEEVIKFINAPVDFEKFTIRDGETLQTDIENAVISVRRNGVALKGTIEPNLNSSLFINPNVEIRNNLDLFVNIAWWKNRSAAKTRFQDVDVVAIRQNTEGEYSMLEHQAKKGVIESLKIITRSNTERIAKWAFDFATYYGRKKVTIVHKANIMKVTDGLFLKTVKDISKQYPHIKCNDIIIDNCSMQLVSNPYQFDIIIMPNLYGTVLNNVLCGLTGGPGLTAGANYGYKYAMFEPACRTLGKSIEGQNRANPVAMLNATADLLHYLKRDRYACIIKDAIEKTICLDKIFTPDLGGSYSSQDMVKCIIENIAILK